MRVFLFLIVVLIHTTAFADEALYRCRMVDDDRREYFSVHRCTVGVSQLVGLHLVPSGLTLTDQLRYVVTQKPVLWVPQGTPGNRIEIIRR